MFVKDISSDQLIEVLALRDLFNPMHPRVIERPIVWADRQLRSGR